MIKSYKKGPCYYCGNRQGIDKEHIPPRYLFKGIDCDAITVPSCPTHNTDKSGTDQAIISALALSAGLLRDGGYATGKITPKVSSAIDRILKGFGYVKKRVKARHLFDDPPEMKNMLVAHLAPGTNIFQWVKHMAAGLVWSQLGYYDPGIVWDNAEVWSPDFKTPDQVKDIEQFVDYYETNKGIIKQLDTLPWRKGWTPFPRPYPSDMFSFNYHIFENMHEDVVWKMVLNMVFINGISRWYVFIPMAHQSMKMLANLVNQDNVGKQVIKPY